MGIERFDIWCLTWFFAQIIKESDMDSVGDEWVDTHYFDRDTEMAPHELGVEDDLAKNKVLHILHFFLWKKAYSVKFSNRTFTTLTKKNWRIHSKQTLLKWIYYMRWSLLFLLFSLSL